MSSRRASRRDLEAALADARGQLRQQERELRDLHEEAEILREAADTLIHHAPARERFAFIHALRDRFAARRICHDWFNSRTEVHAQSVLICNADVR